MTIRKELTVFVNTIEQGEEISIASVVKDRRFVIINTGNGKVTANVEELQEALAEINAFNEAKGEVQEVNDNPKIVMSYGEQ